jgi:hypothetical protein
MERVHSEYHFLNKIVISLPDETNTNFIILAKKLYFVI